MSTTEKILNRWRIHRDVLLELVKVFPQSEGDYRPTAEVMSVKELIHHIAATPEFFFASIEEREMNIPPVPETLQQTIELLEKLTIEHRAIIQQYSEEDLLVEKTILFFNKTEPIEEILQRLITHEAHHKGQLMLYARLLHLEPPFYTIY